jgi:hypothetical protein
MVSVLRNFILVTGGSEQKRLDFVNTITEGFHTIYLGQDFETQLEQMCSSNSSRGTVVVGINIANEICWSTNFVLLLRRYKELDMGIVLTCQSMSDRVDPEFERSRRVDHCNWIKEEAKALADLLNSMDSEEMERRCLADGLCDSLIKLMRFYKEMKRNPFSPAVLLKQNVGDQFDF